MYQFNTDRTVLLFLAIFAAGFAHAQLPEQPFYSALSNDGRYRTFSTMQSLVAVDTNGKSDIYIVDQLNLNQPPELISVSSNGVIGGGDSGDGVSYGDPAGNDSLTPLGVDGSGRFVVFESVATNLSESITGLGSASTFSRKGLQSCSSIYIRDRQLGQTQRVSSLSNSDTICRQSARPVISADGSKIAFVGRLLDWFGVDAYNMGYEGPTSTGVIVVVDRITGTKQFVHGRSSAAAFENANLVRHFLSSPSLSADGTLLVYSYLRHSWLSAQSGGQQLERLSELRLRNLQTNEESVLERITQKGPHGNGYQFSPQISSSGRFVIYTGPEDKSDIEEGNVFKKRIVYRLDLQTGETIEVANRRDPETRLTSQRPLGISADGRYVLVFNTDAKLEVGLEGSNFYVRDCETDVIRNVRRYRLIFRPEDDDDEEDEISWAQTLRTYLPDHAMSPDGKVIGLYSVLAREHQKVLNPFIREIENREVAPILRKFRKEVLKNQKGEKDLEAPTLFGTYSQLNNLSRKAHVRIELIIQARHSNGVDEQPASTIRKGKFLVRLLGLRPGRWGVYYRVVARSLLTGDILDETFESRPRFFTVTRADSKG